MIRALIFRTAVVALLIGGFFYDVKGARNVFYFIAWFLALGFYLDAISTKARSTKPPAIPTVLTVSYDVAIIATLVWLGAWLAWIPWMVLAVTFHADALRRPEQIA